ncbi:hypothetical protein KY46_12705 [Photobacterium halotolerans]|uniref:Uncharacterized protein n=1 Tax=Photobacterium halotolerans TaxID=265726 RepID=A0A0F5VBM8_9GAMM|nr:hypothetical protein KY46_12705 [Photobacterium halotolerans]
MLRPELQTDSGFPRLTKYNLSLAFLNRLTDQQDVEDLQKWTYPVLNWNQTLSQLSIHFPNRVDQYVILRLMLTLSDEQPQPLGSTS